MGAVVHHGGAGTVAAGLRASKPTLVCPFFGDQFFWGEVISRAGVGPKPINSQDLSVENLSAAFIQLKSDKIRRNAEAMAEAFAKEVRVREGRKTRVGARSKRRKERSDEALWILRLLSEE